jgi:hypothetical protein
MSRGWIGPLVQLSSVTVFVLFERGRGALLAPFESLDVLRVSATHPAKTGLGRLAVA